MSRLQWCYLSNTGVLYTSDSDGIVRVFSTARGNSWKVICDLQQHVHEKDYTLWPVFIEYSQNDDPKPKQSNQSQPTWSHRILSYELYKRKEPIPATNMPNLKSTQLKIPFSHFSAQNSSGKDKKVQEQFETTLRERILWDELVSTHGTTIQPAHNRQLDTPWVFLGLQLAQQGQTIRALHAAKQIRDTDVLIKFIEKVNTFTNLNDISSLIKELTKILHLKQQFKKLGLFPYQVPLPHAAMYKSKEIATLATQPQHLPVNPFASPQVPRTAAATAGFTAQMKAAGMVDVATTPSPAQKIAAKRTDDVSGSENPFKSNVGGGNPFRK
jgi:hypothetical protein